MTAWEQGAGYLTLSRDAPAAHIAAACLCAAGTTRPPRGDRLQRLVDRIRAGEAFTATLAGARIEATGREVGFFREPGEARRQGPPLWGRCRRSRRRGEWSGIRRPISPHRSSGSPPPRGRDCFELPRALPIVWDGRYELTAAESGLTVRPLQGLAARLPSPQRQALKGLPAAARPGLPAVLAPDGTVTCPILAETKTTRARCLVVDRFEAATGRVDQEPAT